MWNEILSVELIAINISMLTSVLFLMRYMCISSVQLFVKVDCFPKIRWKNRKKSFKCFWIETLQLLLLKEFFENELMILFQNDNKLPVQNKLYSMSYHTFINPKCAKICGRKLDFGFVCFLLQLIMKKGQRNLKSFEYFDKSQRTPYFPPSIAHCVMNDFTEKKDDKYLCCKINQLYCIASVYVPMCEVSPIQKHHFWNC